MLISFYKANCLKKRKNNKYPIFFSDGTLCAFARAFITIRMADIDFIRLSALVFATRLIGQTADPISEGVEMAERLFNKLKEKEA